MKFTFISFFKLNQQTTATEPIGTLSVRFCFLSDLMVTQRKHKESQSEKNEKKRKRESILQNTQIFSKIARTKKENERK